MKENYFSSHISEEKKTRRKEKNKNKTHQGLENYSVKNYSLTSHKVHVKHTHTHKRLDET